MQTRALKRPAFPIKNGEGHCGDHDRRRPHCGVALVAAAFYEGAIGAAGEMCQTAEICNPPVFFGFSLRK